jgi:diguanylate cyclase (GGDEF)-like protein
VDDTQDVESLYALFRELGNTLDLDETVGVLDRHLKVLVPYRTISLHLVAEEGLRLAGERGPGGQSPATGLLYSIPSQVAVTSRPTINAPFVEDGCSGVATSIPLERGADLVAVLTLCRAVDDRFSDHDLAVLLELAPKLAAASSNAVAFQEAARLARLDPLTGESSSRALFERLDAEIARLRRGPGTLAVVECAVRGPEVLGFISQYDSARQILDRVARELANCCREYDFVARCGDEFVVVLPQCERTGIETLEARIKLVVAEIGLRMGFPLTVRLGAAYCPEDGMDAEDLLASAERRLLAGGVADNRGRL